MEDAVCSVCGYTEKAKGHQYVDGVCTVCGKSTFQAQQEDATRTTTSVVSEVESTLPRLDPTPFTKYGETIRSLIQTAHDEADDSIFAPREDGVSLAQSSTENLRAAQAQIDEAIALCKTDDRLSAVSTALTAVAKAIKESASVKEFYDDTFLNRMTAVRSDCTKGLEAMKPYLRQRRDEE